MRNFLTIVFGVAVFIFALYAIAVAFIYFRGASIDFSGVAASPYFWACIVFTQVAYSWLYVNFEGFFMRLAGAMTLRLKLRHGLAFALFVAALMAVLFLPIAVFKYPFSILALTVLIAALSAFVGGYARGWLIERWTGGDDMPVQA